jgi:hypothetical protein
MTDISRTEARHRLDTFWTTRPVVKKRKTYVRNEAAPMVKQGKEKVEAGILREVKYHSWIANPVMVRKKNGS